MSEPWRERAVLGLILVVAAALRLVHPGADVPPEFERTDAPIMDAFWYLEHAAARVEGVEPEVTGHYEPRAWVAPARVWLEVAGASLPAAGVLGGAVSLLTVALAWRLARARLGPVAGLAAAAVLAVLPPFLVLGRTTLIYGPATLALVVAAALWLRARDVAGPWRHVLEVLAWALALGTTIAVRPPLGALCGGLACAQLVRARRPLRAALTVGAALAIGAGLVWLVDPGGIVAATRDRMDRYLIHASLEGLARRALRVGGEPHDGAGSGYLALAPATVLLAGVGLLLALLRRHELRPGAREALALLAGWLLTFLAGSVAFDYRPLRYFTVIGPPLAALAGFAVAALVRAPRGVAPRRCPLELVLLGAWGAVIAVHAGELVLGAPAGWSTLGPLALAGALLALVGSRLAARPRARHAVAGVALGLALGVDLVRDVETLAAPSWSAVEANRLAGLAIGRGARLAGPLASVLALGHGIDRRLAPWIDTRPGAIEATVARLRAEGITHVALSEQQAMSAALPLHLREQGLVLDLVLEMPARPRSWPTLVYRIVGSSGYEPTAVDVGGPIRDPQLLLARVRAHASEGELEAAVALIKTAIEAAPGLREIESELVRASRGAQRR